MAKREFSAGGIVLRKQKQDCEVLLIKDSYGRWTWPKGKIDPGEKAEDAALREIAEEVGLKDVRILAEAGRSNYFYRLKGELISKTVVFFLAEAGGEERLSVQTDEIQDAQWFKPDKALEAVEYKGAKEMLEKALILYRTERKCSG